MRDLSGQHTHRPGQHQAFIVDIGDQRHPDKQNGVSHQKDRNGLQNRRTESIGPLINAEAFSLYGQEKPSWTLQVKSVLIFCRSLDSNKAANLAYLLPCLTPQLSSASSRT